MQTLNYFARTLELELKRNMEYKIAFWSIVLLTPLWTLPQLLFMEAVFSQMTSFVGYTKYESYLFIGTFRLVSAIMYLFLYGRLSELKQLVRGDDKQTFDMILVKPIDSQVYGTTGRYVLGNISGVIIGIGIIMYALMKEPHEIGFLNVVTYFWMVCLGVVFLYATFLILRCFLFWFTEFQVSEAIWDAYQQFGKYPTRLYTGSVALICNVLIPVTLMAGVPVDFLLGRISWEILLFYTCITGILFMIGRLVWFTSINKYSSSSS